MSETNHECLIGLWYRADNAEIVTVSDVARHIRSHNEMFSFEDAYVRMLVQLGMQEYHPEDLFDLRKNRLPIQRFKYCPECGKKIDWKGMREEYAKKQVSAGRENKKPTRNDGSGCHIRAWQTCEQRLFSKLVFALCRTANQIRLGV